MKLEKISTYIEVLKPRQSALLAFIGVSAGVVAGGGHPPLDRLLLALVAILLASAGVNGLTNYLDHNIDAKMRRTRNRALPSKRINPPQKVLPLLISLVIIGLSLAWWLSPFSFLSAVVGTVASVAWRKRATCVFPQGMLASCAPVLMGWFAIKSSVSWELALMCVLIAFWLPLHVWSIMIANREDYINAGLTYFPMSRETKEAVKALAVFSLILAITAVSLYYVGGFRLFYLIAALLLSIMMVYATLRLVISRASQQAWKLYKLSSFPYLGLIFLVMSLDIWLR